MIVAAVLQPFRSLALFRYKLSDPLFCQNVSAEGLVIAITARDEQRE